MENFILPDGKNICSVIIDGIPYFSAVDVALMLKFSDIAKTINCFDDESKTDGKAFQQEQSSAAGTDNTCSSNMNISEIAEEFGMSPMKLNIILELKGIQRSINGSWCLNPPYDSMGLAIADAPIHNCSRGKASANAHNKWTPEGRKFIHKLLREAGILPLSERK